MFTIQTLLDKPNLNGVICSKDVIENAYKNADYEQSTASLYSGGNNPAITHKIHTHLVH